MKIGVGINTGEVLVGNMGSEYLYNYSVLGTEVNVASRIESLNKDFGTSIIISENTLSEIGNRGVVRNLGSVNVKGIERDVRIFSLSGIQGIKDSDSWSRPSIA
jgi:adenylate cyclase